MLENIFLKPPHAIAGPEDNILIPKNAESIFPELELCVVIGKKTRNLSKAQAFDAIFGYTIMLDVTARGYGLSKNMSGTRSVRKGFETFAPIGPWITTKDEIADPHNLWMKLWINGELKQSAKTDAMINDIATQISFLSQVTTFYPGDLLTTGNPDSPEFQEKLKAGDVLKSEIEGIGAMNLGVARASKACTDKHYDTHRAVSWGLLQSEENSKIWPRSSRRPTTSFRKKSRKNFTRSRPIISSASI